MAAKQSAGILLHRVRDGVRQVFLVHPGGPIYASKDDGVWQIPKGEFDSEDPKDCALREFEEETGQRVSGEMAALTPLKQRGKTVYAWVLEGDCDAGQVRSNLFTMEWPPKSGHMREFPEVDRAAWFTLAEARAKILPSQAPLLDEFEQRLAPT